MLSMAQAHLQPLLFLLFLLAPAASSTLHSTGFRVALTHVDSTREFTKLERLQRAARRSTRRLAWLMSKATASGDALSRVETPVHSAGASGEYLMDLSIGTPAVPFSAIVDTGSDLIWTQCAPCTECFPQPTPIFDPSNSSTFSTLPCTSALCTALPVAACRRSNCLYRYSYMDNSSTQGVLSSETFTFGSSAAELVSVPGVGFGCGQINRGAFNGSGLVGLGRGPLSLVSQLELGKFSYCLTTLNETKPSPLLFGSLAELNTTSNDVVVQTTPLITNPSLPTFYYISLLGITVGSTLLPIPSTTFSLKQDGSGGTIIDSGTSLTYLDESAYDLLRSAFGSQMELDVAPPGTVEGLDLCFVLPSSVTTVRVPKVVFHFDGADMDLPPANYLIGESSDGVICLTINGTSGVSILGNIQQQNFQILYDLENEKLAFVPAECDQL